MPFLLSAAIQDAPAVAPYFPITRCQLPPSTRMFSTSGAGGTRMCPGPPPAPATGTFMFKGALRMKTSLKSIKLPPHLLGSFLSQSCLSCLFPSLPYRQPVATVRMVPTSKPSLCDEFSPEVCFFPMHGSSHAEHRLVF